MKRLRLLPERLGLSAPTLFVCLFEPATLFHYPSIAFYRGPSTLPSPLPPRFAVPPPRLSRGPPSHPARETRFKSHSVVTRLPSNGCIESAPLRPSRCPSLFHRRASDTALTFHRSNPAWVVGRAVLACGHVCQSIPQQGMCGTESHRRRTYETGSQKPRATLRQEIHATQEVLEARVGAQGLFQICVFRLGLLQDGDIGVGVFPEREEILIGRPGFDRVTLEGVSTRQSEASQRAPGKVHH